MARPCSRHKRKNVSGATACCRRRGDSLPGITLLCVPWYITTIHCGCSAKHRLYMFDGMNYCPNQGVGRGFLGSSSQIVCRL